MRLATVVVALVLVSFPANAQETSAPPEPNIPLIRRTLEDRLVDYSGARFRNVRAVRVVSANPASNIEGMCGQMNAPSRAGGMTGWQWFVIDTTGKLETETSRYGTYAVQAICLPESTIPRRTFGAEDISTKITPEKPAQ